jgi:hypothetical protein
MKTPSAASTASGTPSGWEADVDYQTVDIAIKGIGLALSVLNSVCLAVLWIGTRGRVTKDAIDRVESQAKGLHAEQEARIIRLEADFRHAIGKEQLVDALKPLYDLVRKTEAQVSGIDRVLQEQRAEARDLKNMILQRGIDR